MKSSYDNMELRHTNEDLLLMSIRKVAYGRFYHTFPSSNTRQLKMRTISKLLVIPISAFCALILLWTIWFYSHGGFGVFRGRAFGDWYQLAQHGNDKERDTARNVLLEALHSPLSHVRYSTAKFLAFSAIHFPADSFQAIKLACEDLDPRVRADAIQLLSKVDVSSDELMMVLEEASKDQETFVRESAASATGKMVKRHPGAIKHLIRMLNEDQLWCVKLQVLFELRNANIDNKHELLAICRSLGDENESVRLGVLELLAGWGNGAQEAIPAILPLLNDPSDRVKAKAAETLRSLQTDNRK